MRYVMWVFGIVLFLGCGAKDPFIHSQEERVLDFGVVQSKKVLLSKPEESIKTYATVSYLTPIKDPRVSPTQEQFIIGIYVASKEESAPDVQITRVQIEGIDAKKTTLQKLPLDAPLLDVIATKNPWAHYWLVQAPRSEVLQMRLSFESDRSERVSVGFQKDY